LERPLSESVGKERGGGGGGGEGAEGVALVPSFSMGGGGAPGGKKKEKGRQNSEILFYLRALFGFTAIGEKKERGGRKK